MRPLTTIHVSTQRGWHGGEEQARLLVRGLRERGHACILLANDQGAFARRMAAEGFDVRPIAGRGRSPAGIWRMRRIFAEIRPDVVHFHDPHGLSGGGIAAWQLSIPVRIAARRVDFPIRSTWRYKHFTDRVIAVSHAVADVCRSSGVPAEKIRVVHDGVDPARAHSGNRQRGRQSLASGIFGLDSTEGSDRSDHLSWPSIVLTVATLTDHKGHKFLLQAVPVVLAKHPNAFFVLAGDGELRGELEALACQLKIEQSVRFLGYRDDIPDLLHAADLFVMPSHMEGLCSTLIDAMFARVPIVTTTAGGIPDVVGDIRRGETPVAFTAAPRDPVALATAIDHALLNPSELAPMIERAQSKAAEHFTADSMVEGTLAVYAEVLSHR